MHVSPNERVVRLYNWFGIEMTIRKNGEEKEAKGGKTGFKDETIPKPEKSEESRDYRPSHSLCSHRQPDANVALLLTHCVVRGERIDIHILVPASHRLVRDKIRCRKKCASR